jgi:hypothetical protein
LPAAISTVNLDKTSNFEKNPLFRQNVLPFSSEARDDTSSVSEYGKSMQAATYFLGTHPLRAWLESAVGADGGHKPTATLSITSGSEQTKDEQANRHLRQLLKFPSSATNVQIARVKKKFSELPVLEVNAIVKAMHDQYSGTEALRRAESAYQAMSAERKSES